MNRVFAWLKCHIQNMHEYNTKSTPPKKWVILYCNYCKWPKWIYYNPETNIVRYYRGNPLKGGDSPYDKEIDDNDTVNRK